MHYLTLLEFHWLQLLQPQWYIENGGLWFILFVVFAETGLFAGFFLPGDSLLFVAGIYSEDLIRGAFHMQTGNAVIDLLIMGIAISLAGIIGNAVGYWFGKKSGPFLFERKDTFFYKKKYLLQAKDFYDKHGGGAIVMARFIPIVRTFAPIVAGIVQMDAKKFSFFNIIGCVAWVFIMIFGGHYLQKIILNEFDFDLKKHLEVIVIGIVLISTLPVVLKMVMSNKKK
jgi:membrane-associated protein